jgi:hypothetical protein
MALSAGTAGAEIIFDDDFDDTASANQADLVAAVNAGSWVEVAFDNSSMETDATKYLNLERGGYDYIAVFSKYGSASDGGTISMDLSFGDSVHDYNTISILEGTGELFRIEVQTDDGGVGGTDAQINLVGATTENIVSGIRESTSPNRTFEFTLDATGVDLSITGDGLGAALTASVDYSGSPVIGPDRIRFYKNHAPTDDPNSPPHRHERGKLRVDNVQADFEATVARYVLIDFNDGNTSNGIHDVAVNDGDFSGQVTGNSINLPWQSLAGGAEFQSSLPAGIGSDTNGVMAFERVYAVNTGHTLASGDVFNLQYFWRDAYGWDGAPDNIEMVLYYTESNAIDGNATDIFTLNSGGRSKDDLWEVESATLAFADESGIGKKLFVRLQGTNEEEEFARIDNIFLEVVGHAGGNQPVGTSLMVR